MGRVSIKQGVLVLEDGTVFKGMGFGAISTVSGEVVFNTGMVGYTESITDPSYWGQILVQTYPLIGNYGISSKDFESSTPKITGYVISECCINPSHHSSEKTLDSWLTENNIPGIQNVDTRALTKKLREEGTMLGILQVSEEEIDIEILKNRVKNIQDPNKRDLTREVTRKSIDIYGDGKPVVALVDCGVKRSIIDSLVHLGVSVIAFPVDTPFERVMEYKPDGLLISNGPGDPKKCSAIDTVRAALEYGIPTMGICLGNQIIALAAGADTYKLKFGHRSQNQPCIDMETGRCYITSQNHGFAIDSRSLPRGWREWFVNINDRSNEGMIHEKKPFMSVQFHPEASPGPTDTQFLIKRFIKTILKYKN
ncbi:MAG TPA: carbamoyl-phosphate synthase (glutamine-hydrolyzing) small subunit [Candidatus Aenigmarchaeota archaeon]|nr:carbamoyl-phosphate synthase (glutamine-hydrolyzing) small subunit [Candidatus Aenigmarchaeota archaeon]